MAQTPPERKDENASMHLHEVLAAEFQQLHEEPPPGSLEPVPLEKERDVEKAKEAQEKKQQEHLEAIWAAVHGLGEKRAALCISGGGIRSATFALGVLQGLARCGLLGKFHYLSTVSGGGYIGGWLSAWIQRAPKGLDDVAIDLAETRDQTRPNPEAVEIQNLRSYSNYLSPRPGLLSADTWTLVATYVRNLILTCLVFVPLLAAALTVPWLYASVLLMEPTPYTILPLYLGLGFALVAIVYMGLSLPAARHKRCGQGWFLLWCLTPLFLSALFMTTHWAWFTRYGGMIGEQTILGVTHSSLPFVLLGVGFHILAWTALFLIQLVRGWKSVISIGGKKLVVVVFKQLIAVFFSGAIGGWLLWLAAEKLFPQPLALAELYCCFAVPLYLMLFYLAITIYIGLCSRDTSDEDREWWARACGWILIAAVAWAAVSILVVFGPLLLSWTYSTIAAGGLAGIITMLAGLSKGIPANSKETNKASPIALILSKGTTIAALVFAVVVLILIVSGLTLLMKRVGNVLEFPWDLEAPSGVVGKTVEYLNVILYTPICALIWLPLGLATFALVVAYLVNPNKFSLHAMYRDRLIRAYLGASHKERKENRFTGFDESDNLRMHELWSEKNRGKELTGGRLLPVVNMALNLVHGKRLAWQDRKATSFTASPLHCGSVDEEVGYRKTKTDATGYGGKDGISLGTAITISGAAASPNMGYHSSPFVTFILTLLNVRLGAWLGNPGPRGDNTFYLGYPRLSIRPIVSEAFGLTDDTSPYVYLSDGGHFENLGLYEMVLRRCHYIVVSDAGQDPKCSFADLGEAVRKIRIDFGISIEFKETMSIYARSDDFNEKGRHAALGRICYSMVDGPGTDGILIYLKPACYGNEPRDIYEYFKRNVLFPHESTADQFFTESQFESYRMLGAYTMDQLCSKELADFPEFIRGMLSEGGHLHSATIPAWLEELLPPPPPKPGGQNTPPRRTETGI
ncbi:MAG: hypothetical protein QOC70_1460 [Verrucomicrobiota bacterium]|jgi:hypothetical protein